MRKGPGAAESRGKFAEVFDGLTRRLAREHGALPAVLCGMVGSTFGWLEVPYLPCPEELDELAEDPARRARRRAHRSGHALHAIRSARPT